MRNRRRVIAVVVLVCALSLATFLLRHYWYQPTYSFVYTDNARIDGAMARMVSENQGQVVRLPYDIGDEVEKLQPVVTLKITPTVPVLLSGSQSLKYIYKNVLAPISGIIANRWIDLGDTVSPGQSLLTIVDPNEIWVIANIDENDICRVQPGQRVDIHVDATNDNLQGRVEYIVPSTTSIVQRMAQSSLVVAANTQDVPVKIVFEQKSNYYLYPGLSVEVTIYTK